MATIAFIPPQEVARELELLVQRGRYRDLPEAMTKAARLLVQRERAAQAIAQIQAIRRKLAGRLTSLRQSWPPMRKRHDRLRRFGSGEVV